MILSFILAIIILLASLGAVWFARPVHAALAMALTLAMVGVMQIALGAHFIGLVPFMVYVGAVAELLIFALLMTSRGDESAERCQRRCSWVVVLGAAAPAGAAIACIIPGAITAHPATNAAAPSLDVARLGELLFTTHAAAVLAVGVVLTAVLIGAALLARDPSQHQDPPQ